MRTRRHIAAISLLASVLLGGLVAPLSHFAYMAFSDAYGMSMDTSSHQATDGGEIAVVSLSTDAHGDHLECPFAAFFLHQSPAVSTDTPVLTHAARATSLAVATTPMLIGRSTHTADARAPPVRSA